MHDDANLLRRYARDRSEAAFAELVGRHLNLVYFSALRALGGDEHLARDVAQGVFTDLARKAEALSRRDSITGWLYTSARFAAIKVVRSERRRQARELEAFSMEDQTEAGEPRGDWNQIRPVLDESLAELDTKDREALLLRFFQGRGFPQIGRALRLSEDAARMRVNRALARLHRRLVRRGVTSTEAAVGAVLTAQSGMALPMNLHAGVIQAALSGSAAGGASLLSMALAAAKSNLLLASVGAGLATLGWLHYTNSGLAAELDHLRADGGTLGDLRAANLKLSRVAAEAESLRTSAAELPRLRAWAAAIANPAQADSTSVVTLRGDGTLAWQGTPVTLKEFLEHLQDFRRTHPEPEARLLVQFNGGDPSAAAYVFNEARKAGFKNAQYDPAVVAPWDE